MSDWYPQVVRIEKVVKHPNADALSIATTSVGDYPIVVKLDEYKPGDMAAYIPIDTVVPDIQKFYFLCPRHDGNIVPKFELGAVPEKYRRIKAKRLRGQYSQGMLVAIPGYQENISFFLKVWHFILGVIAMLYRKIPGLPKWDKHWSEYKLGDSVSELFNLTKWEEEEEDNVLGLTKEKKVREQNEKRPIGWSIPYYDIEGMRKYVDCLLLGEEVVLTEKLHGANASFSYDGEKLWVKSRNFYKREDIEIPVYEEMIKDVSEETGEHIKEMVRIGTQTIPSTDQWWDVARRFDLATKLSQYPGLVFFGEVYGQVKGFRYDAKVEDGTLLPRVRFFDIWDLKQMKYLDYDDFLTICQAAGLDVAPELYRGQWLGKEKMYPYAEGKTTLGGGHVREGFVLRTVKERFDGKLGRMQVKLVGEGYNLQK